MTKNYYIVRKSDKKLLVFKHKNFWGSKSAATQHINREGLNETHEAVECSEYVEPPMREVTSALDGKTKVMESINTPFACSVASETFFCS